MRKKKYYLVINPGSTSTKLGLYKDKKCERSDNLRHDVEEIKSFKKIYDQKDMRKKVIMDWLKKTGVDEDELCCVVARGGLIRSMPGGTYKVTDKMVDDLRIGYQAEHASNLGGILAKEIGDKLAIPSFIVDPVAVDEFDEVARISGMPEIKRRSLVHALNIKAVTRRVCKEQGLTYEDCNFVVAHLGGGISIAPIRKGRIIDVNNANEDGPFSPERCGGVPVGDLIKMCYSGKYTLKDMKKKMVGEGGFVGYLGTNDGREVAKRIEEGDKYAELIFNAMAYQLSKEIASMATTLCGDVDKIIITGGLAYDKDLTSLIKERVSFIADVVVFPGEEELLALYEGAYRVINGEEKAKIYEDEVDLND